MKKLLLLGAVLVPVYAIAQQSGGNSSPRWYNVTLSTNNATFTVPANVTSQILVDGCGVGGSGGGGQASAATAGGGGGGGATCVLQYPIGAVAGSVITATIPTPPTGGAAGSGGTAGGTASLAWTLGTDSGVLRLLGGSAGAAGSAGTGGGGGASALNVASMGGQAGVAAGTNGNYFQLGANLPTSGLAAGLYDGFGGGGGGNTAGTAGGGGLYLFRYAFVAGGGGNGAGGSGGGSLLGQGQPGTAAGVACSASPTWNGWGGGGCGAGSNAAAGPGGPAVFKIWYQQ